MSLICQSLFVAYTVPLAPYLYAAVRKVVMWRWSESWVIHIINKKTKYDAQRKNKKVGGGVGALAGYRLTLLILL